MEQGAQIFLGEPCPTLGATGRPQIARQATGKTLASILDLDILGRS
jgi:hypothetical protein